MQFELLQNRYLKLVVDDLKRDRAFLYSILLHGVIIFIMVFGIPKLLKRPPLLEDKTVLVELMQVKEITNLKNKPIPDQQNKKIKESISTPNKIIRSAKAPKPSMRPERISFNQSKNKNSKVKPVMRPKKEEATENKQKPSTSIESDLDSLLKTLEKPSTEHKSKDKDAKRDYVRQVDEKKVEENKNYSIDQYKELIPLSLSEKDSIKKQISDHWDTNLFKGAKNAQGINAILHITVATDGTISEVRVKEVNANIDNPAVARAFADSVVRAAQKTRQLKGLPINKYESWKELLLNFNPEDMIY